MNVHNFSAGPAIMPAVVLQQIQEELRDYHGTGMSIMEMSHRSAEFEVVNREAQEAFRRIAGLGDEYKVLFVQGGASTQFALVPMNFLPPGGSADYLVTGAWGEKAIEEAAPFGQARLAASTREGGYRRLPLAEEISLDEQAAYVHLTTNETIHGTQWQALPDLGSRPLIADMSSDIFSRPFDYSRFALVYAGAQKNLGPSGVTVVVVHEDLLATTNKGVPTMLRYTTHAKNSSLYNTPPTFGVYALGLVLQWIEELGGLEAMERRNAYKASLVYGAIDKSGGFYQGHAEAADRSLMNVTFRLPSEALEKRFVEEAKGLQMIGLGGHRAVGGIRASIYNALEPASCVALAQFMGDFAKRNG
jgi:phosphoserine aminotransferase